MILKKRIEERIGEILLRQGIISQNQLKQALEAQKKERGLLGEVLVKLGFVNERQIAEAITSQYGFPYIPLENYDFNPEAAKLVPEGAAKQYKVVPLDIIGDTLLIAMSNPLNRTAIEDIEMITQKKVQSFIAIITEINEAIEKIYKAQKEG